MTNSLSTYRAVVAENYGEPSRSLPMRSVKENEILIRVHSAGLNPADWKVLSGILDPEKKNLPTKDKPFEVGFDVSGEIAAIGDKVSGFQVRLELSGPASLPVVSLTSYQALFRYGEIKSPDKVLILNGSGGTGSVAIQLAHAIGAYVATTTSSRNTAYAKSLGEDQVIDYTKEKFADALEPHSFDIVYDCVHGSPGVYAAAQGVLKPEGHFISIVEASKKAHSTDCKVQFPTFVAEPSGKDLNEICLLVEKKQLIPNIEQIYDFEDASTALERVKRSRTRGKIVLQVQPPST